MKKLLLYSIIIITVLISATTIYLNLPFEITRKSDIRKGNELIERIEEYKEKEKKLPDDKDFETLEKLGFKTDLIATKPLYTKNDNGEYEIVYSEGFDGPFLIWNSNEKIWKMDYPKILK
ncbi:MAG: hypothetical protein WHS63_10770 [Tenuifilum sp.]|uniref:hypothetical protein n=1 Tax=Tenuifilum sp. TaxID=2760880 RepID=UPI00309F10B5